MIAEKVLEKMHIVSRPAKLILGSTIVALMISLGMIGILKLIGFPMNPGIPAVMGVIGAAAYVARN